MSQIKYSVVVPVYEADNSIVALHETLMSFFEAHHSYEIIYVDDFSSDNSWKELNKLKESNKNVTIIRLSKNFGQHAATICGFKYAKGEFIITIDDDLEVHPSQIDKLIAKQQETNCDLAYGIYDKINIQTTKGIFSRIYKSLSKIEGKDKGKGSSFRLIKGDLARKIAANHNQFVFIDELCLWYTNKLCFIDVEPNKNFIEKRRYKISGLFRITSTVIMFSSNFPLKMVTYIGLILSISNFAIGSVYILRKIFFKVNVAGYTSLIVSILFSSGLIILCLGVLAQYMSKVLKGVNNSPSYNEDEVIC
jgi:glycosyltransferase involved in cell wall biosynthesis